MRSRLAIVGVVALAESARLARRRLPWFILSAAVVTTIVSVALGAQDLQDRQRTLAGRMAELQQDESKATIVQPSRTEPSFRALRQPLPASVWIRGQDASLAPWWDFSPEGVVEAPTDRSNTETPAAGTTWDIETIIRILLSVLALWLGLESVATERASGTLQAALDQPISHGTLLAGKWIGLLAIVSFATTAVLASGAATALLAAQPTTIQLEVLVLAPAWILAVLYLMVLCAAAMLIGAVAKQLDAATLSTGVVWLYATVLGPQFVASISLALTPSEPRALIELDRNRAFEARLAAMNDSVGRLYHRLAGPGPLAIHPEIGVEGHATVAREWHAQSLVTRQIVEAYDLRWLREQKAQAMIRSWLMFASPGSLFLEAVTEVAGTGQATTDRWRAAVFDYQRSLNQMFFDDPPHLLLQIPGDQVSGPRLMGIPLRDDYNVRDVPRLRPPAASARVRLKDCASATGGLCGYLLFFLALTYVTFPRTGA